MLEKARILLKNKWIIDGSDNNILIQGGYRNLTFRIIGNHDKIIVCDGCTFYGHTELRADGQKSEIRIGEKTTVGSAVMHATEGSKIYIGRECMLSHEIDIRSGDGAQD